jgi:hypothetical protein
VIFCTHRELRWRYAAPETECHGRMVIDPETAHDEVWIADCDECGLSIGIPDSQRQRWLQAQGVIT